VALFKRLRVYGKCISILLDKKTRQTVLEKSHMRSLFDAESSLQNSTKPCWETMEFLPEEKEGIDSLYSET
jgi:hypothetical protein